MLFLFESLRKRTNLGQEAPELQMKDFGQGAPELQMDAFLIRILKETDQSEPGSSTWDVELQMQIVCIGMG